MRRDEAASRSVLEAVAGLLEDFLPEVVFVGGHVAGLLVTTPVLRRFRATLDVGPRTIRIPPAPLYVASKWEALQERGRLDLLASHDLEDIITVVAGRPELQDEVRSAPAGLRAYLGEQARALLGHPDFSTALAGALPEARDLRGLLEVVTGRFRGMAAPFSRT